MFVSYCNVHNQPALGLRVKMNLLSKGDNPSIDWTRFSLSSLKIWILCQTLLQYFSVVRILHIFWGSLFAFLTPQLFPVKFN